MFSSGYFCLILMKFDFSLIFSQNNIKLHEVCPVGTEFLYADGWTDKTKLIVAFRNFADTSRIRYYLLYIISTLNN